MNIESTKKGIERRLDWNSDHRPVPVSKLIEDGMEGEKAIVKLLQAIPGIKVRPATKEEDFGGSVGLGRKGLAIDAVGYIENKPAIGFQVTIAVDHAVREEKIKEFTDRKFIRLSEMKISDTAIPRVLVFVSHNEMLAYMKDKDIKKHPNIKREIQMSILACLGNIYSQTKIKTEQDLIMKLMTIFKLKA